MEWPAEWRYVLKSIFYKMIYRIGTDVKMKD